MRRNAAYAARRFSGSPLKTDARVGAEPFPEGAYPQYVTERKGDGDNAARRFSGSPLKTDARVGAEPCPEGAYSQYVTERKGDGDNAALRFQRRRSAGRVMALHIGLLMERR